jgi:hypothetical protein
MRIISSKNLLKENLGRMNSLKNKVMNQASEMGQNTNTDKVYSALNKINNPNNFVGNPGNQQGGTNSGHKVFNIIANFGLNPLDVNALGNYNKNGCVGLNGTFFLIVNGDMISFQDSHGGTLQFQLINEYVISQNGTPGGTNRKALGPNKLFNIAQPMARKFNFDINTPRNQNKITPAHRYLFIKTMVEVTPNQNTQPNP